MIAALIPPSITVTTPALGGHMLPPPLGPGHPGVQSLPLHRVLSSATEVPTVTSDLQKGPITEPPKDVGSWVGGWPSQIYFSQSQ